MLRQVLRIFVCVCVILASGCAGEISPVPSDAPSSPASSPNQEPAPLATDAPDSSASPPAPVEPPPPPPIETRHITLTATGDLMVHSEQLQDAWDDALQAYSFHHSFEWVETDLREGDLCIGNLETVLGGEEIGYSDYPQFNTPDSFGEALAKAGFNVLSTANNHCLDKYESGLLRTLEQLDRLDIAHTGTFASRQERDSILLLEKQGFKIALLSYTFSTNGIPIPAGKEYLVNMLTEELLFGDLEKARALDPDLIVVMPHMGDEYATHTHPAFAQWMELMIYHGADIVLAHHPHVLQSMKMYPVTDIEGVERTGFIIHSLGNFISSQQYEPRERSIILKLDISMRDGERPVIDRVRFVPTWVQFRDVSGNQLVRVLPVHDAIISYKPDQDENPLLLRAQDVEKLHRVNAEITALFLGSAVPTQDMAREYVFYQREQ